MQTEHWNSLEYEQSKQPCPILGTHRRLQEVHELWHQTCSQYHNPVGFRTNLNAMIQTLRNVTFILQKEKAIIPEFDQWYETVRQHLRSDPILSWLHRARNIVVKEGDLSISSTAKVKIMNWLELASFTFEVPPYLSSQQIGQHVRESQKHTLGQFDKCEAVLRVERRWSVREFPDKEIVDLLAYAYYELEAVIAEAHSRCGYRMETVTFPDMKVIEEKRLPCMEDSTHFRVAHINLQNGLPIDFEEGNIPRNKNIDEQALKRYGIQKKQLSFPNRQDPFAVAETFLELAKKMLIKDKAHVPIVFLFLPNGNIQPIVCPVPDQESKYVIYEQVARHVQQTGAKIIICIGEMWTLSAEDYDGTRPSRSPVRQEDLALIVASSDGKTRSYHTPFTRNWLGQIRLQPTIIQDGGNHNFLNPIWRVWGKSLDSGTRAEKPSFE